MKEEIVQAYEQTKTIMERAYAPYSGLKVGAAIKSKKHDQVFFGNNVENAVNGASVCAERHAIGQMVSEVGANHLEWVVVVASKGGDAQAPCGVCRQVLFEFCEDSNVPVFMFSHDGDAKQSTIGELLPMVYKGKDFLKNY